MVDKSGLWKTDAAEALKEAAARVDRAVKENLPELDFHDLSALAVLPENIRQAVGVRAINLGDWRGHTQVTDLGPLSGLTALTELGLDHTPVTDLGPLSGLTALTRLWLNGTPVTDLGPLSGLTALTQLWLNGTPVTDLGPLSALTALTGLRLGGTPVTDLGPLSGLTALTGLGLDRTPVTDLGPLSGLTALTELWLDRTQVTDLGPLSGLTALTGLWLDGTQVTDLGPLSGLTALTGLRLGGTQVTDLRPILPCVKLADDPDLFGLTFHNTPATTADGVLAELAKISNATERGQKTFEYLRNLPPYPLPLDWDPATDTITPPDQSPVGMQAGEKPDGRVGFGDQPLDQLSPAAQDQLHDQRRELAVFLASCAAMGDNSSANLAGDLAAYDAALNPESGPLDATALFRAARVLRRLDRAEQARAKDDLKERHYDEAIGEALNDLAAGHNMLAAQVPALLEKDQAAHDPALRPTDESITASRDVVQSMVDTPAGFDPEVAEILEILGETPATTHPEERDQVVGQETAYNLIAYHTGRAWGAVRQLLRTPEGQKMKWEACYTAGVVFGVSSISPLLGTSALPLAAGVFLSRNEKVILTFLKTVKHGDYLADIVIRLIDAFRMLDEKLGVKKGN